MDATAAGLLEHRQFSYFFPFPKLLMTKIFLLLEEKKKSFKIATHKIEEEIKKFWTRKMPMSTYATPYVIKPRMDRRFLCWGKRKPN